jgi:hypothetical protein
MVFLYLYIFYHITAKIGFVSKGGKKAADTKVKIPLTA